MARPIAPRFEITVLKNKSGTDTAQVPATDATIKFYRQGATVKTAVTLPSHTYATLSVYDVGQLAIGDTVRVDIGTATLSVLDIPSSSEVQVWNGATTSVGVLSGARLVPTNNPPQVYADPLGTVPLGTSISVDGVTARASAYLSRDRVDYDVSIPGQTPRLYVDASGVMGRSDQRWNDIRDFGGDVQAAIDALPGDGGIVFVPRGTWLLSSGITVAKAGVTIMGEQDCSVLRAATANSFDLVTVTQGQFQMRDLKLDGAATSYSSTGKSCLVMLGYGVSGNLGVNLQLQNVVITGAPRYGLYLRDVITFLAEACNFDSNKGSGTRIETVTSGATSTQFISCTFSGNGDRGCECNNVSVLTFLGCTFEANKGGVDSSQGNGLDALDCARIEVMSSLFRNADTASQPAQFVFLHNCQSAVVDGCMFDGGVVSAKRATRGVYLLNSTLSRLSSCSGKNLGSYLADYGGGSLRGVEYCNGEIDQAVVRFNLQPSQAQMVGMSRAVLSIPVVLDETTLPTSLALGALVWVYQAGVQPGALKVWNGATWNTVTLS